MLTSGKVRKTLGATAAALLSAGAVIGLSGSASAEPPNVPDPARAASELAALTVAPDGSMDGYDRDLFPHWHTVEGSCNTREVVLRRDGSGVEVGSDCYPTSGSWYSPYDGATWSNPSDLDIDHMVPLANAWRTGAASWSTSQREFYANDLGGPELWAVTDNVNQSKGDQDPSDWRPPLRSSWCQYASAWIHVKYFHGLTVNAAEHTALNQMLGYC